MRQGSTLTPTRVLSSFVASWLAIAAGVAPARGSEPEYPASRLGVRTAPLLLLSRPDVRADLALDAEQAASAERTITELWIKAAAVRGKTGPEAVAARRAIDEAQRGWVDSQLSAEQRGRLAQVDLQWEGPSALISRPIVAEGLGLSPDQRASLTRAIAERDRRRAEGGDSREIEHALAEQALQILTADQRTRWQSMLGRPFVPQLASGTPTRPGPEPR